MAIGRWRWDVNSNEKLIYDCLDTPTKLCALVPFFSEN